MGTDHDDEATLARPPGRPPIKPSVDDEEAVLRLCAHLIGGMGMKAACSLPECPSRTDVYLKMSRDDEFRTLIARAREAQQDALIDDTVDMADDATPEDWQVVKLRIWARQWRAAKLAPKKYGEKSSLEVSGPDGAPLVQIYLPGNSRDDAAPALSDAPGIPE